MSNGTIALLGGLGLITVGISVKKKIENLKSEIRLLQTRVSSLVNEKNELAELLKNKDAEISEKNKVISTLTKEKNQLKEQLQKSQKL